MGGETLQGADPDPLNKMPGQDGRVGWESQGTSVTMVGRRIQLRTASQVVQIVHTARGKGKGVNAVWAKQIRRLNIRA